MQKLDQLRVDETWQEVSGKVDLILFSVELAAVVPTSGAENLHLFTKIAKNTRIQLPRARESQ